MQAKVLILTALVSVAFADNLETDGKKPMEKDVAAVAGNLETGGKMPTAPLDESKKNVDKRGLLDLGIGYASPYTIVSGPSVVTSGVHTNTIITKEVPVVVSHSVAVPVEKPVPVIQKVAVPVDRPIAIPVPKPVTVEVSKPVPVPVPVHVPAPYPLIKHVSVSSPLTHAFLVEKHHSPLTTHTYTFY